jgi:hypothetical protein
MESREPASRLTLASAAASPVSSSELLGVAHSRKYKQVLSFAKRRIRHKLRPYLLKTYIIKQASIGLFIIMAPIHFYAKVILFDFFLQVIGAKAEEC